MLTTNLRIKTLAVAALLTAMSFAGTGAADAADHRESPILAGPFLLTADDAALVDDVLDVLGIEPVDLPPRQTREHILLARISRPDPDTGRPGGRAIYILNRRQARMLLVLLTFLDNPDRDIVWADGMFIRYPAGTTYFVPEP